MQKYRLYFVSQVIIVQHWVRIVAFSPIPDDSILNIVRGKYSKIDNKYHKP